MKQITMKRIGMLCMAVLLIGLVPGASMVSAGIGDCPPCCDSCQWDYESCLIGGCTTTSCCESWADGCGDAWFWCYQACVDAISDCQSDCYSCISGCRYKECGKWKQCPCTGRCN